MVQAKPGRGFACGSTSGPPQLHVGPSHLENTTLSYLKGKQNLGHGPVKIFYRYPLAGFKC